MRYLISYIAAACLLAVACNKPLEKAVVTTTTSDTTVNFVNRDSMDLYVTLYSTITDLRNGTNAVLTGMAPAAGNFKVPFSQVDTQFTTQYYFEQHSENYRWSSWASYYEQSYPLFYSGHAFFLSMIQTSQAGYYFLHGNENNVTWKAVDKVDWTGNSIWSSLSADERYMSVTLNRNRVGTVQFKSSGSLVTRSIGNMQASGSASSANRLDLTVNGSTLYGMYNVTRPGDINGFQPYHSRDTVIMADGDYWVLARQ